MGHFEHTTSVQHNQETVFSWFSREGALRRLFPPFGGHVVSEPPAGLAVGSEAKLLISAPGITGSAASAVGEGLAGLTKRFGVPSRWARPEVAWTARHTALDAPHMFRDQMAEGPLESWVHTHEFVQFGEGTDVIDSVEFQLPSKVPSIARRTAEKALTAELERTFAYRARQLRDDLDFHARYRGTPRLRVGITGATGFMGVQLRALLTTGGHIVHSFQRGIDWDPEREFVDLDVMRGLDVIIHLAGHPIGGRFTDAAKQEILDSRVKGTRTIANALRTVSSDGKQRAFISASGVGYYGSHPHREYEDDGLSGEITDPEPLTEDHAAGDDFLASVCAQWEAEALAAASDTVRVAILRTGLVLSPDGGLLARLLPLFAAGVGGPTTRGAWNSWISRDDMLSLYVHAALTPEFSGIFNAVAPNPVSSEEFAATLGSVIRRPSAIPTPSFGPKLLLGAEGADELAFASQRVSADKVQSSGFVFRHPTLDSALEHMLGSKARISK